MIYANEAHTIAENNNHNNPRNQKGLQKAVDKVLLMVEKIVRDGAEHGYNCAVIKREALVKPATGTFFTKKEIMDAVSDELKKFGYETNIPQSYTSLHITW